MSDEQFIPRDFVFIGRVIAAGGKLASRIAFLDEAGAITEERRVYIVKRRLTLGGIYSGATFNGSACKGIETAQWMKQYRCDAETKAAWEVADSEAVRNSKLRKLEASVKADNAFDSLTIKQVREMYHAALARGDTDQAIAIVHFAQNRISKFVTKADLAD